MTVICMLCGTRYIPASSCGAQGLVRAGMLMETAMASHSIKAIRGTSGAGGVDKKYVSCGKVLEVLREKK